MAGLVDCESLFADLETKKVTTWKFLARHSLSFRQALEQGKVFWLSGSENPADGSTKVRSDTDPLPRILEHGLSNPGSLRQLKGAFSVGGHGRV